MPNAIGPAGLTVATQLELLTDLTAKLKVIYGLFINIDPDSPDAQLMNIYIQACLDLENLLVQINAGFDPDQAIGRILDQRVTLNGIQRQAGTYTITNVTLLASGPCNLYGLDQDIEEIYTVQDNAGNQWELIETQVISGSGTYIYAFSAKNPGEVLTIPNTITTPVTVILNIVDINNPTTYTTLGVNEETDAQLRVRRLKSVSLSSQGYRAGLLAALDNINGISTALVYENITSVVDSNDVPGHSIWVIVLGGDDEEIAQAIYTKRNAGCGMKGDITYIITQKDGSPFVVRWDTVEPEALFIKFTATSLDGVNPPNIAAIRAGLVTLFAPAVNEQVNINDLATMVQEIDNNTLVTNAGFSTSAGGIYTNTLSPTERNYQFAVTEANIIIIPMILSPTISTVVHGEDQQFIALGGYGTLTYSLSINNSGGTIDSSTGVYTAGATPSVVDTVLCVDSLANSCNATVNVT